MEYNEYEVAERMKDMMWKFPSYSKEYKSAQATFGFLLNRIREKAKVELIPFEEKNIEEALTK